MKRLIYLCKKGLIPIVGSGGNKKSLTYLKDVTTAIEAYLSSDKPLGGEVFNLSSGDFFYNEIIDAIEDCYGYRPLRIRIPMFMTRGIFANLPVFSTITKAASTKIIDIRKIKQELNYVPVNNIREAFMDCKEYYI